MMLNAEELSTKKFILSAKDTFEEMARTVIRTTDAKKYSMLNNSSNLSTYGKRYIWQRKWRMVYNANTSIYGVIWICCKNS